MQTKQKTLRFFIKNLGPHALHLSRGVLGVYLQVKFDEFVYFLFDARLYRVRVQQFVFHRSIFWVVFGFSF